jgi:penicillin-binding protein 1A
LAGPGPTVRRRNPLWRFRRFFFVLAILGVVGLGSVWAFASQVELTEDNFEDLIQTTYICTAEVTVNCGPDNATNEISSEGQERVIVDYDDIPEVVIEAVIATEDKSFFEHRGVDPGGVLRAAYQVGRNEILGSGGSLQGGSTITQQYIKLATSDDADAVSRKAREMVRAIKFEQELTAELGTKQAAKEEVLERYLNRAYFGRSVYGIEAAAQVYFGKPVQRLQLPEAAYLAGLIRNPTNGEYFNNPDEATRRRTTSLASMLRDGYITQAEFDQADADTWSTLLPPPIIEGGLGEVKNSDIGTEYFVSAVRQQLPDLFPEGYFTESLRVYTTLDPDLQRLAYNTVYTKLDPAQHPDMPLGSMVALDLDNRVIALVGGSDWETSKVNLATGRSGGGLGFQAGSQMKTFALAEYIEQGFSPESYYEAPFTIRIPGTEDCDNWKPSGGITDNKTKPNHRTVYQAMAGSTNTVFAQMVLDIRVSNFINMAERLGIESEIPNCPSSVLGTNLVSPLEMASSYSTLLREGLRIDPVMIARIEDAEGNVLCYNPIDTCVAASSPNPVGEEVLDPSVARQVNGAMQQVVTGGTGRRARLTYEDGTTRAAAGKTGTTSNNRDAWFTGFTCGMTTSVWVGVPGDPIRFMNDRENQRLANEIAQAEADETGEPLPDEIPPVMAPLEEIFGTDDYDNSRGYGEISGGNLPAELWRDFMLAANADAPACDSLPTEGASSALRIQGQELLTTLLYCVAPDASWLADNGFTLDADGNVVPIEGFVPTSSTTVDPNATTTTDPNATTVPGEVTGTTPESTTTETTAAPTTQPPTTQASTTAPPTTAPPAESSTTEVLPGAGAGGDDDEQAAGGGNGYSTGFGFGAGGADGGSLSVGVVGRPMIVPVNTQQQEPQEQLPETTTTVPIVTTETTEPCLPVDNVGSLLSTLPPAAGGDGN